jgi:6-phosphogluconate dehydrogenase
VVGLRDQGARIVRCLLNGGHQCVVFDPSPRLVAELAAERAYGASSVHDAVNELDAPRALFLTGAPESWDATIAVLLRDLDADDIVVVWGDASPADDVRRAGALASRSIHYVDVGVGAAGPPSREAWCLSIGGEEPAVRSLEPLFATLAASARGPAYLYCGPAGAGHFVGRIYDAVVSNVSAAYAEGLDRLAAQAKCPDALSRYEFDIQAIATLWRTGSSIVTTILDRLVEAPGAYRSVSKAPGHAIDFPNGSTRAT